MIIGASTAVAAGLYQQSQSTQKPAQQQESAVAAEHHGPDTHAPEQTHKTSTDSQHSAGNGEESNTAQAEEKTREVNGREFSEDEYRTIQELQNRDREVRAHEQAHLAAAGQYATGGPSFSFQQGPDGKRYAVGGEVGIDTSPIPDDPQATLQKARQIRAAAMAPAEPSGQDRAVAAQAAQMAADAQQQIAEQRKAETQGEEPVQAAADKETAQKPVEKNPGASEYEKIAGLENEQQGNRFSAVG